MPINVKRLKLETLRVPIVGTSPLIMHCWDQKAVRKMLDAQQGRKSPKEIRDPQADYEASIYRTDDGYGFPILAFRTATIRAARLFDKSVPMTVVRQALIFRGVPSADRRQELAPIVGEPKMREDMVKVGTGTDVRYRAEFLDWSAELVVSYPPASLDAGSVLALIEVGGLSVGVGDWRPEKTGTHGTYRIADEVDRIGGDE